MDLKHPLNGAVATAAAVFSAFHLDVLVVLLTWGWGNLSQLFYMGTLLVSGSPVIPVSQSTAAKIVGALAMLLLLKLVLKAREQVDNRLGGD